MEDNVYVKNGVIYSFGNIVLMAALLIDRNADVLLKYGDASMVQSTLAGIQDRSPMLAEHLQLITFDPMMFSPEEQVYTMLRAINFTASGFVTQVCDHFLDGTLKTWVDDEMKRVPLNVYEGQ